MMSSRIIGKPCDLWNTIIILNIFFHRYIISDVRGQAQSPPKPSPAQPTGGLEDAILSNIEKIVGERDEIKIYQVDHGAIHQDSGENPSWMMTSLGVAGLNNVIHFHLNTLKLTPHMHLHSYAIFSSMSLRYHLYI